MAKKTFNFNEYVWVKLTEKGREIYLRWFEFLPEKIRRDIVRLPEVDDDGYSRIQMWQVMQIFGSHLHHGDNPPFDSDLRFDMENFKD